MTKTNFVGLVNPTYNNAFTIEHTNRSIPHNDLFAYSPIHLLTCRKAFTMADRLSRIHTLDPSKTLAFTMAEILLSLTIIGVVAAITLPSLMANINERTWNTQRKALYARMSQAIAMMPQVGGYGKLTEEGGSVSEDTAAETFLTEGLSKVLKINNICDNEHLQDCGVPTSYTNFTGTMKTWPKTLVELNNMFNGSFVGSGWGAGGADLVVTYSQLDTKAAAFETQNGETVALYYNPNCIVRPENTYYTFTQPYMCANFIYDLNGNKGPNTVGKDVGVVSVLYPEDTVVVAPMFSFSPSGTVVHQEIGGACNTSSADSRVANVEELMALFYNRSLFGISLGDIWTTERFYSAEHQQFLGVSIHFCYGRMQGRIMSSGGNVLCIKR